MVGDLKEKPDITPPPQKKKKKLTECNLEASSLLSVMKMKCEKTAFSHTLFGKQEDSYRVSLKMLSQDWKRLSQIITSNSQLLHGWRATDTCFNRCVLHEQQIHT